MIYPCANCMNGQFLYAFCTEYRQCTWQNSCQNGRENQTNISSKSSSFPFCSWRSHDYFQETFCLADRLLWVYMTTFEIRMWQLCLEQCMWRGMSCINYQILMSYLRKYWNKEIIIIISYNIYLYYNIYLLRYIKIY